MCLLICGHYRPNCARLRKHALVLMYDPLDNHEIAFGVVHFALCMFPLFCAQLRGRYCPPLHVALPAFGSRAAPNSRRLFVVRCAMLSRMHAVWFRAEYRPSPSGTPSRSLSHPAEFTPLILLSRFTSLRARYTSRHSRFLSAALCSALWPRVALT